MILRKPYAFFIKHFKLIHLILVAFMGYLTYRTKVVLDFFNQYIGNVVNVTGQDLTGTLLYGLIFVIPIIIILISISVMIVMIVKKKPYMFYIVNIFIYTFTFVILEVSKSTLLSLEQSLLDIRTIRLVRDFITLSFVFELISCFIVSIRAIGFDIKKFDFKKDLQDLQIEEEDSEEFEVELAVDKNKLRRNLRRTIRFAKYVYKENKKLINSICVVFIVSITVMTAIGIKNMNKTINQNTFFRGNNFSLKITNTYLTDTDYQGNLISEDNVFVIVQVYIRNTIEKTKFDIATAKLMIGPYIYTPRVDKKDKLFDFGNIYNDEAIGTDYEYKTFIYEIPKGLINQDMTFSFVDKKILTKQDRLLNTKVKIAYQDLTKETKEKSYSLNDTIDFKDTILSGYTFSLQAVNVQKFYKLQYNFCVLTDCYHSYEYIKPNVLTNYNKALLKITGILEKNPDIQLIGVSNVYNFINTFATLEYTIGEEKKVQNVAFQEVVSKKKNEPNTYYIEVLEEVVNATHMTLSFRIRNQVYKYVLK